MLRTLIWSIIRIKITLPGRPGIPGQVLRVILANSWPGKPGNFLARKHQEYPTTDSKGSHQYSESDIADF